MGWRSIGVGGAGLYLAVLPAGHVTALRSLSILVALVAAFVLWLRDGRPRPPLLMLFAVWLVPACLSLLTSHDLGSSLNDINIDIVRSFLVFFTFYVLSFTEASAWRTWIVVSATAFGALSALTITTFARQGEWSVYYVPPLGDFATSALTVLTLLLGYYLLPGRSRRLGLLVTLAVALTLVAGSLTLSRSFCLVLILGPGAVLTWHGWRAGRYPKGALLVVAALVATTALGIASVINAERGAPRYLGDRLLLYSATVEKIARNSLTGTGYGNGTDRAWYQSKFPGKGFDHPHNIALSFLDQMGPLGLAALVAIFGLPVPALLRGTRSPSAEARAAGLCGLMLLAAVLLKNMPDYFFDKQNLWLFFAHLGIYLGVIARMNAEDRNG